MSTTMTVTIHDMQSRLQELLAQVSRGRTIIIEKDHKPFARLVGVQEPSKRKKRIAGLSRGAIKVSGDFDAPLPDGFWLGEQ
jgi:antitoxin (DNA-binding transcriptional repressor) of toxin-antitoxin stability system